MDGGPPCFPLGSSCPVVLWIPPTRSSFHVRGSHSLRRAFPNASAGMTFAYGGPQPRGPEGLRFGLVPVRSPLLRDSHVDSSSSGYLDVSVRRVPLIQLCVHCMMTVVCTAGFPHSEISGSRVVCTSPELFAAYHVFLRLPVPRHPPCALSCITNSLKVRDVLQGNTYSVTCSGCLV